MPMTGRTDELSGWCPAVMELGEAPQAAVAFVEGSRREGEPVLVVALVCGKDGLMIVPYNSAQ